MGTPDTHRAFVAPDNRRMWGAGLAMMRPPHAATPRPAGGLPRRDVAGLSALADALRQGMACGLSIIGLVCVLSFQTALAQGVGASRAAGDASPASLTQQRTQARQQQADLRERIAALQKDIESQDAQRQDAANALKASESAISTLNRELSELRQQSDEATADLERLRRQTQEQEQVLAKRRLELADQLRAQYASGLSPWTALLSGDDPQAIGRDLGYLGYVSQAQADAVRGVQAALTALERLRQQSQARRRELDTLARQTETRGQQLQTQQQERQQVLARLETQLRAQRAQAGKLTRDEQRLSGLVTNLDAEIVRQEQKRREEARRREQEARRLAQEREAARKAEQQAREAQARARRERDQAQAEQARLQVEQARDRARQIEQEQRQRQQAQASPLTEPPGGFPGLKTGLPYPVQGEVQGRFGAQRPEGGVWRGIVIRADEGAQVRAVAAGKVVYAAWLAGFGNLVIVDHGAQFLSVYAYNQSLLHEVGDIVRAGDPLAVVGATGGQVEPGLYFEIRQKGVPVNPQLWLRR